MSVLCPGSQCLCLFPDTGGVLRPEFSVMDTPHLLALSELLGITVTDG